MKRVLAVLILGLLTAVSLGVATNESGSALPGRGAADEPAVSQ